MNPPPTHLSELSSRLAAIFAPIAALLRLFGHWFSPELARLHQAHTELLSILDRLARGDFAAAPTTAPSTSPIAGRAADRVPAPPSRVPPSPLAALHPSARRRPASTPVAASPVAPAPHAPAPHAPAPHTPAAALRRASRAQSRANLTPLPVRAPAPHALILPQSARKRPFRR